MHIWVKYQQLHNDKMYDFDLSQSPDDFLLLTDNIEDTFKYQQLLHNIAS